MRSKKGLLMLRRRLLVRSRIRSGLCLACDVGEHDLYFLAVSVSPGLSRCWWRREEIIGDALQICQMVAHACMSAVRNGW